MPEGPSNEPQYTERPDREATPIHQHHPSREIRGDIDKSNVMKGSRGKKPRREAYLVQLNKSLNLSGYSTAFTALILENKRITYLRNK